MPMPVLREILNDFLNEAILQPGFLRSLDRASKARTSWPEAGVQRLLQVMKKRGSLGDVCARFGLFDTPEEERHVREDWFGESGKGWWPKEPMEALFRKGMTRAIELLREHDLPLASYWRIGKDTRRVQITFALSPQQITLLISTPPPRARPGRVRMVRNPKVWVVARSASGRIASVPGLTPVPDDEPHIPRIPCKLL
ncbi:MAG: hypothetical protein ABI629_21475 [bacterium]